MLRHLLVGLACLWFAGCDELDLGSSNDDPRLNPYRGEIEHTLAWTVENTTGGTATVRFHIAERDVIHVTVDPYTTETFSLTCVDGELVCMWFETTEDPV